MFTAWKGEWCRTSVIVVRLVASPSTMCKAMIQVSKPVTCWKNFRHQTFSCRYLRLELIHIRVCWRMHHALEIQEILSNIFGHFSRSESSHLLALAITCRAFKEPALDVLWADLDNLSPLVRCLPEAFHQLSQAGSEVRRLQAFVTHCLMRSSRRVIVFVQQIIDEDRVGYLFKLYTSHPTYTEVWFG